MGTNHISGAAGCLKCCQLRWTVSVVNWWPSSVTVCHTDCRHLCTARWAQGTASRGSVSGSGYLSFLFSRAWTCDKHTSVFCIWLLLPHTAVCFSSHDATRFSGFSSSENVDNQRIKLFSKKLSYRRGTAPHAALVNSCYVSWGVGVRKVSSNKRDLQGHSWAMKMVPFDATYDFLLSK